jgi:hypothetical protein
MSKKKQKPVSVFDALHQGVFGFVPAKQGTAYERLSAVVFAALGWVDVEHDRLERPPGKRAEHQLDVVCQRADGSTNRLIVECKDWNRVIGEGVVNTLVGVRSQAKADAAAIVTRKSFTKGARNVAADEDIAMVILRAYDPAKDDGSWIQSASITLTMTVAVASDVEFLTDTEADREALLGTNTADWMGVCDMTEELAETYAELWQRGTYSEGDDGFRRGSLDLPEGRLAYSADGRWIPIRGLRWTMKAASSTTTSQLAARGTPVLVLQQLDANGNAVSGKVMVDAHLNAWDISANGAVVPKPGPGPQLLDFKMGQAATTTPTGT